MASGIHHLPHFFFLWHLVHGLVVWEFDRSERKWVISRKPSLNLFNLKSPNKASRMASAVEFVFMVVFIFRNCSFRFYQNSNFLNFNKKSKYEKRKKWKILFKSSFALWFRFIWGERQRLDEILWLDLIRVLSLLFFFMLLLIFAHFFLSENLENAFQRKFCNTIVKKKQNNDG